MRPARRGSVALYCALVMPGLIAAGGMAAEAGLWQYQALRLQQSADASALAGALTLAEGYGATAAEGNATRAVALAGLQASPSVTLEGANRVSVTLSATVPLVFVLLVSNGRQFVTVAASASASASSIPATAPVPPATLYTCPAHTAGPSAAFTPMCVQRVGLTQ